MTGHKDTQVCGHIKFCAGSSVCLFMHLKSKAAAVSWSDFNWDGPRANSPDRSRGEAAQNVGKKCASGRPTRGPITCPCGSTPPSPLSDVWSMQRCKRARGSHARPCLVRAGQGRLCCVCVTVPSVPLTLARFRYRADWPFFLFLSPHPSGPCTLTTLTSSSPG